MKSIEIEVRERRWVKAVSGRKVREQLFSLREWREGKGGKAFRFTGFEDKSSSWVRERGEEGVAMLQHRKIWVESRRNGGQTSIFAIGGDVRPPGRKKL